MIGVPENETVFRFDTAWVPKKDTPAVLFDIETNGLLETTTTIHCICAMDWLTKETFTFGPGHINEGLQYLSKAPLLVAHNGLCFDMQVIAKLAPAYAMPRCFDTLVASRLIYTDLLDRDFRMIATQKKRKGVVMPAKLAGTHKLESWGYRLGCYKGDYGKQENAWEYWSQEMQDYCEQDVQVLAKLYDRILSEQYSPVAFALEHEFQEVIFKQEQAGVPFDEDGAQHLYADLCAKRDDLKKQLQDIFPPEIEEEVFIPKVNNKTRGYVKGEPFIKRKTVEFNPQSRDMIADRLMKTYGWKPSEFTETGQPKVDDDVLQGLDYPACKLLSEYLEIAKVIGMLAEGKNGWLKLIGQDKRIHGRVITNGAVTGRCTHSRPNLAQIPAHGTYGKECRALFIADPKHKDWVQVGADASGLELRMLAHYMGKYDGGKYGEIILGGDIHTANQKAAGLATRDNAKTFIYAFLYGAGDAKIGSIVAPGTSEAGQAKVGKQLKTKFFRAIPAVKQLVDAVQHRAKQVGYLYGLDRRRLHVRSSHSALNTLLQSAGAVLVKMATVLFHKEAERRFRWKQNYQYVQVLHVHDEAQFQCHKDIAEDIGKLFVECIELAGQYFGLRCPTTGEYKIGPNWAETH